MRLYTSPDAAAAKLPFSQAVQVGDVLYLSGALGHKPGTREVVAGGIEAETRRIGARRAGRARMLGLCSREIRSHRRLAAPK